MFRKYAPFVAALALALTLQSAFAGDGPRKGDGPPPPRPGRDIGPREGRPGPRDGRSGPHNRDFGPRGHWGRGPAHDMGMGPIGHGMFGPRFMDELELTEEQKTQMVDAMTATFREGLLARMEMAEARKALRNLREMESTDADAIISMNEAMGAAKGKMDALRIKAKEQFDTILTPEQRAKLDERKDDWKKEWNDRDDDEDGPREGRRGPRHGRHGPGPRGPKGCW
ncbi:MAG: Spy/CpxP family protein refolding chaperone [Planctomycetaceae bacterium]|nr:Spy/CpxP family protein refolding chaperone [Planctomycetaceae bacterium]